MITHKRIEVIRHVFSGYNRVVVAETETVMSQVRDSLMKELKEQGVNYRVVGRNIHVLPPFREHDIVIYITMFNLWESKYDLFPHIAVAYKY